MKQDQSIRLQELVEGFLFSLRAEGKSNGTVEYYSYLFHPFLSYAHEHGWPNDAASVDSRRIREFLSWTAIRTFEQTVGGKGGRMVRKGKPSTSWPYFRALRRFFK